MLEQALTFAARGWPVFPCIGKTPALPKHEGGRGCHDATTNADTIKAWWKRWPRANIALATGKPSNVVVVDVDDGQEGEAEIAKLGTLPKTLEVVTGSGNRHLFFERPAGEKWGNTARGLPHIDTRGDGGYVILPPSIHPVTKKPYTFVDDKAVIAPLPLVIVDAIYTAKSRKPAPTSSVVGGVGPVYAEAALRDECRKLARMGPDSGRNDQLNTAAHNLGQLVACRMLDEQDVRIALWNAAMTCGLGEDETLKTIESGISAGLKKPRQVQLRSPQAPARQPLHIVEPDSVEVEAEQLTPEEIVFAERLQTAREDLIAAGFGGAEKRERRQLFKEPASQLFDMTFPDTPWLVRGLVTECDVMVIAGEPKSFKTWAAMELAMAIATRTRAFGEFYVPAEARRVSLFLVEDKPRATRNRLRALAASRGMDPKAATANMFVENLVSLNLNDLEDLANIVASVRAQGGIAALVLDPMRDLHDSEENDSKDMKRVMAALRVLRTVLNCTIIFTHHMGKESKEKPTDRPAHRMRGSTSIHGAIDAGLYLYGLTGNQENEWVNKAHSEVKAARSAGFFSLKLCVEDTEIAGPDGDREAIRAEWIYEKQGPKAAEEDKNDPIARARQLREAVLHALSESKAPLTQQEVRSVVRRKQDDVTAAIHDLIREGRVKKHPERGYSLAPIPVSQGFLTTPGNGEVSRVLSDGVGKNGRETVGNRDAAGNAPDDEWDEWRDGPRESK